MEAVTALGILAVIITGVLVAVNHSVAAMVDNRARVMAFETARENMERLLGADIVSDTSEFGVHELNEDIQWQNIVESFHEPVKSNMWIRAVCSASYTDRNGERQTIELTHWITDLTKTQENQILDQKRREKEFLEEMDGNPFGEDPDGLMQYADALADMGDYERAAQTASQLILDYPGEPQAAAAWPRLLKYPEYALIEGNAAAADTILHTIMDNHGYKPDAKRTYDKLKPVIDSGGTFLGFGSRGSSSQSPSSGGSASPGGSASGSSGGTSQGSSGSGAGGAASGTEGSANTGGSGQGSSGGGTGAGSGSHYPNPNWSAEQKRIWDMFMNL